MSKTPKAREGYHKFTNPQKKLRCLKCGKLWMTDAGHRTCPKCRGTAAFLEGSPPENRLWGCKVHIPRSQLSLLAGAQFDGEGLEAWA